MGALTAPLHPAAARGVSLGIPIMRRSGANGIVTGAALLGVAATYVVFGWLIDHVGWPWAFVVAAAATFGLGVSWLLSTQKNLGAARGVPEVSTAARAVSRSVQEEIEGHTPLEWLGRHKNLILLTLSYAAVGYFQYLFFYWIHYYFETVLQLGSDASRKYATYPCWPWRWPCRWADGFPTCCKGTTDAALPGPTWQSLPWAERHAADAGGHHGHRDHVDRDPALAGPGDSRVGRRPLLGHRG